jgi:lipoyl(octanoyl) transferase
MSSQNKLRICRLGRRDYAPTWHAMQQFTAQRTTDTPDEIWLVEHPPVYTQGLNGKAEHLLTPGAIPVVQTDRGGQITYHGPGQLLAYVLVDLKRKGWGVRDLVSRLEQAVIDLLHDYGISAVARRDAPGVYVDGAKIAALGLRVKRGCSYHGLSFNVDMDLEPFSRINPCGYAGLPVTHLRALGGPTDPTEVAEVLLKHLCARLGYNDGQISDGNIPR